MRSRSLPVPLQGCDADAEVIYQVPSQLAIGLKEDLLILLWFPSSNLFQNPDLELIRDIHFSRWTGQSVRLFSKVHSIKFGSVALDTSSLTSTALIRLC